MGAHEDRSIPVKAFKVLVVSRYLLDVHTSTDFAPKDEIGEPLMMTHDPPAKSQVPADRFVDECGEDVEEVGIGDRETTVDLVHSSDGAPTAIAIIAPFQQFAHNNIGIVVPFLRVVLKFPGPVQ